MRRARVLPLTLSLLAVAALAAPGAATADPVPGIGEEWPKCGAPPDDDNRYCVVSAKKNGVEVVPPVSGVYQQPYVDLIGSGTVRFGVWQTDLDAGHQGTDVPPDDTYELVVNTGSIRMRELFGNVRDASFARGGSAAEGYTFTLTFRPTPVAWREPFDSCVVGACGGSSLVANFLRDGFVTGYVTNLAGSGLDAAEIAARDGYVHVHNAQDASLPFYDFDSHSLLIRLANPHLREPGVPATGSYRTFLPYAMLTGVMNVPDPSSLTGGALTVSRTAGGSTTSVPFTLTHDAAGVEILVPTIAYSSPTYRIRPKRTRPGPPRLGSVRRVAPKRIRVDFRRPLANGGAKVTRYIARCRTPGGKAFTAAGKRGPIVLRGLPKRRLSCTVRAVNRLGKGPFAPAKTA